MTIQHRAGKMHQNADGLSRLTTTHNNDEAIVKSTASVNLIHCYPVVTRRQDLPNSTPNSRSELQDETRTGTPPDVNDLCVHGPAVTQVHLNKEFTARIVKALPADRLLGKCYRKLRQLYESTKTHYDGPTTTFESFSIDPKSQLMFFHELGVERSRLCLPAACYRTALELAHDMRAHSGIHKTYDFLKHQVFLPRLKRLVTQYVAACPVCRQAKPLRRSHKGLLQPIQAPPIPLATLCLDFVTGLPMSRQGHDAVLIVTDKFTKAVGGLPGGL